MDWKPAARPTTLSETIYQSLRRAIVEGEIQPGQKLQEKKIAELFHASPTPVREAFFRLAAEKYLVISAWKDVVVQDTTLEQVIELYEIVRILDKFALAQALKRLQPREITELKQMTRELGRLHESGDHQGYLDKNLQIHDRIWRACGNKSLYDILTELMAKISIYRRKTDFSPFSNPPALEKSYYDHRNLIKYIEAGDLARLVKLINGHWGEEIEKS